MAILVAMAVHKFRYPELNNLNRHPLNTSAPELHVSIIHLYTYTYAIFICILPACPHIYVILPAAAVAGTTGHTEMFNLARKLLKRPTDIFIAYGSGFFVVPVAGNPTLMVLPRASGLGQKCYDILLPSSTDLSNNRTCLHTTEVW